VNWPSREPETDGERRILAELRDNSTYKPDGPAAYILREGSFQRRRVLTADQAAYVREVRKRTKKGIRGHVGTTRDAPSSATIPRVVSRTATARRSPRLRWAAPRGTRSPTAGSYSTGTAAEDLTLPATVAFYGVVFSRQAILAALDGAKSHKVPSLIDDWKRGPPVGGQLCASAELFGGIERFSIRLGELGGSQSDRLPCQLVRRHDADWWLLPHHHQAWQHSEKPMWPAASAT
jgi:hypothetical protein